MARSTFMEQLRGELWLWGYSVRAEMAYVFGE